MTQQEFAQFVNATEDAKKAGEHGFMNYTREMKLYSFVVGNDTWNSEEERRIAEYLASAEYPATVVYEFAASYFKAHGIKYAGMELYGKPSKHQHGDENPDKFHVCFDVLVEKHVD